MTTPSLEEPQVDFPRPEPIPPTHIPDVTPRSHPSPWAKWGQRVAWGLVFTSTAVVSAIGGVLLATTVPLPAWVTGKTSEPLSLVDLWQSGFRYQVTRPVNVLLLGIDEVPGAEIGTDEFFAGRTDTMLLARVNPDQSTLSLLSIPRDTRVEIPGDTVAKINHANIVGGPEKVAETIQTNFGAVPIDRYVRINTGAFRELVDLMGGVEVYVPQRMVYEDRTQGLKIDLQEGWQTLNGDQAEQFARFRADGNGDIGRVQRQQILLKALRERLASPMVIPRLPQILRVMMRYVDTNLSLEEMLALANFSMQLESENLQMVMLPGRFSTPDEYVASYWIPDFTASQQVMNQFFQLDTVALLSTSDRRNVSSLLIAVQNASGRPEAAQAVATTLRQQGFENVYVVPNWPGTVRRTQVIAQRGDINSAGILTSVLGIGHVVADSTGDLQSELTIRIGEDWLPSEPVVR